MTESGYFFWACVIFISGVLLNSIFLWDFLIKYPLILFLGAIIFLFSRGFSRYLLIFIFFLLLGMYAFQFAFNLSIADIFASSEFDQKKVTAIGIVSSDYEKGRYIVKIDEFYFKENIYRPKGKFFLLFTDHDFAYGDKLKISGKYQIPPSFEDFDYRSFLAKDRIYGQFFNPDIEKISSGNGNYVYAWILQIRKRLISLSNSYFSGNMAAFFKAYILGAKEEMNEKLQENLLASGLTHVVAISGAHIVIIEQIIFSLLIALGFWRKHALWATFLFILFFLALSGFQISAIRAVIMGSICLLGKILGKRTDTLIVLICAAAVMLAFNPLLLKYDAGFQLSFAAVLGMTLLSGILRQKLKFLPNWEIFQLRDIISIGLGAQLFVLPLSAHIFKKLSIVSLLTNVLVEPVTGLLMFFGLFCLFFGLIQGWLGLFFAFPCYAMLGYIIKIVEFFGNLPGIYIDFPLSSPALFIYYLFVGGAIYFYRKKVEIF